MPRAPDFLFGFIFVGGLWCRDEMKSVETSFFCVLVGSCVSVAGCVGTLQEVQACNIDTNVFGCFVQKLGKTIKKKARFVLCWVPYFLVPGCLSSSKRLR